jgi:predicted Zn-dependent protease
MLTGFSKSRGRAFGARLGRAAALALAVTLAGTNAADAQGLIRDSEIEGVIRDYAQPILRAAGLGSHGIKIHLVNDRRFNAFVVDGQNMFIHVGALMNATTPNQVIGVIAHETGHIAGGHLSRLRNTVSNARSAALMMQILGIAAIAASAMAGAGGDVGQAGAGVIMGGQDAAMRTVLAYQQTEEGAADQAAITFLNATKQSSRGMLETFEHLATQSLGAAQFIDPYLQSHPLPQQRIANLRELATSSPYWNNVDPPQLQFRHDMMRAKLFGFLDEPRTALNRYSQNDQTVPARYARAIATYRQSGLQPFLPMIDALIADYPQFPYFLELKGQFLFESGQATAAIPPLEQAVALAPHEPLLRIMLAQALLGAKNPDVDGAISHLRNALAREDSSSVGYRQLAAAFGRKAQTATGQAAQVYLAQAELASAQAYLYEGQLKLAKAQAERARSKFVEGTPNWLKADDIVSFQPPKR